MDVGYAVVRYCVVGGDVGDLLKFGKDVAYGRVVTLVPFRGYRVHVKEDNREDMGKIE